MKIGLYNLEPQIFNTAMMKVSYFHKARGDEVRKYNHLIPDFYDKVYAFSLFDFTDKGMVRDNMVCGGTGFDIKSKLPPEIDRSPLDYSIFPECKTSYVWFSRGCIRNCSFCIVRKKEGLIRPVWEVEKNLNPSGEFISVMDNNFFASPGWKKGVKWLKKFDQKVEFNSGIDIRIFNASHGRALKNLKIHKQIHIAWDNPKEDIRRQLKKAFRFVKPYKFMCYVLIGYDSTPEEDLFRVEELRRLKVDPFVMPYNKNNDYQRHFARWVNHKATFRSCNFEDYQDYKIRKVE